VGVLNHLSYRPADGTLISGWAPGDPDHGSVYRVAGGAPIYVSNWDHIGGNPGTTVGVDLFAIKNAGGGWGAQSPVVPAGGWDVDLGVGAG
jgi:hypothetical protein